MNRDYIKLNRSILEWEWYQNINTCRLFIHMLLKANWKEGKFEGMEVPRGSFISSYPRLADECGLTVNELRTALKHLISTGEITVKPHSKYSVFTVKNYSLYQELNSQATGDSQSDNRQCTDNAQPINSQLTTIEEKKEEKEGKKERRKEALKEKNTKKEFFPDDAELNQTFADYADMRKKIKAPMTDRAVDMAIATLGELSGNNRDVAIRILEQSIMNSWKGLFPLKDQKKQQTGQSFEDMWRNA